MKPEEKTIELAAVIAALFINPAVAMWLWNWVGPQIFEVAPQVGYWQSFAVMIICGILFKPSK